MATVMTKRGTQDNVLTYEHICETKADMANIDPQYITLGSTCIVLEGDAGTLEVYMAKANKQWVSLMAPASEEAEEATP